ncbi:MAG: ATP-dependent DNA ligase [Actinomycetota bacterium]|nr:ATP-dependent DNA ligase [Actinomycetota bacterium]MDQ3680479.1 ATP-dependent DNA ligase [Actinomycetota bacterium]
MAEPDRDSHGDPLVEYRSMRDFERTPEPAGEDRPDAGNRFVVQEHHATALHWDFRLERDGVLVSWAVPKGVPPDPEVNHLAVHTEDHPISYIDFEGHIPEGEYGGGKVAIWDQGTYECHKWEDREVMVTISGKRARGRYVLFRTGGKNWMMHRMDPPEDPGRELMPRGVTPVTLPVGQVPADEEAWSFEVAWGGRRTLVSSEGGRVRVDGEDGEVTGRYPELRHLGRALGAVAVIMEGEVVAVGADGRPDADTLARRDEARSPGALRRVSERAPVSFFAADVVWMEGHSTTTLPHRERRQLLDRLELAGPSWQTTPSHAGAGAALLQAARDQALAGVVGRRLEGGYEPDNLVFVPAGAGAGHRC